MATQEKTWVDFNEVKRLVSMEALLAKYDVTLRRVNQTYLRGNCPLPTHESDTKGSFTVHTEKHIWSCKSDSCVKNRDGKKGGNVLDFVAVMEKCSVRDAALKLKDWFGNGTGSDGQTNGVRKMKRAAAPEADTLASVPVNAPLAFQLKDVNPKHPYLAERGISEATATEFGVGFFPGKGSMSGRVVIPIHNEKGDLVAYAGRALNGAEPKYLFPPKFHKSLELFNLHRVKGKGSVILVEGFFGVMRLWDEGFGVVGLMGSSISETQIQLLSRFDRVYLMLDGDEAGRTASLDIAVKLARSMFVKIVECPDGKQPDTLSAEALAKLLA